MNRSCALVLIVGMALVAGCSSQPAAPAAPAAQPVAAPAPAAPAPAAPAPAAPAPGAPVPGARLEEPHAVAPAPAPGGPPAASAVSAGPPATALTPTRPAAVPESVAGFPDYPGAVRVAFSQRAESEHGVATRKTEASWTSTDPLATVSAYYQKAITERGWTVTGSESKSKKVEWKLAKATSTGKVQIELGVGTEVVIKIECTDR